MRTMERLQKVMAARGIASRRKCEEYIQAGKVRVNGEVITQLGYKVDPQTARIEVDGNVIVQEEAKVYILLYKPLKVITSVHDPRGRKTVIDLLVNIKERIYPVGRLDYDTEGLLLLTNDGELAYRMTHPSYELEKEYIVTVKGEPTTEALEQLRTGVELEDGITAPAIVSLLAKVKQGMSKIKLAIHEGRNRQVRRMCEHIGHPVIHLQRQRIGFLTADHLKVGNYRHLTADEVNQLKYMLNIL